MNLRDKNTELYNTISYPTPLNNSTIGRNKIMASTASSFSKFNNTRMIRSSSSSFRNAKGKIETLSDCLT